ncbi:MAG: C25 family cysteine peptidase [Candidatus Krumholzibacteria bacterium]|nr:C25 family cysteine peptidase [Candidatus Krumholzibacteria bacterium]
MIYRHRSVSSLSVFLLTTLMLAGGLKTVAAEELPVPPSRDKAARIVRADVQNGRSVLTVAPPVREDAAGPQKQDDVRNFLVALPRGTTSYSVQVTGHEGATIEAPGGLMIMRGQPVLRVRTTGTADRAVQVAVEHDGNWSAGGSGVRLASAATRAALGATLPQNSVSPLAKAGQTGVGGSYLIVYAADLAAEIAPLVDWKTRKGYDVHVVSTAETGSSTDGILAYLQDAYDTWPVPPEYILLVGDVDQIPTFNFYGNPSDQPYVMLDGEDWLMDAMIGRLPVGNGNEAAALIGKTINYERSPDLAGQDWQTRTLMVAGVYASDTPGYTVDFCGERLQDMGFPAPTTVTSPPLPSLQGALVVRTTINTGVGFVVYRGWAYGTAGWDPPTFTVDDIPALDTNDMTPIVMSFVCLNGDYTASSPCFGEVFVRQGSPAAPGKGAVAFIGNGEHWSHTRYNDAMAISIFERIVEPEVTDLGTLLNAGKLRFLDYFPNEISAAEFGEESVEFYFHIYNLMGDPSLKFWRELPQPISVTHAANLAVGANRLAVDVVHTDGGTAVAGAMVGVVQDGVLIGRGRTDVAGHVDLSLLPVTASGDLAVTVSEAGTRPYEGVVATGTAAVYLAATSFEIDDSAGNGDQQANPGETLALTATVRNHGTGTSGTFDLAIASVRGPATPGSDQVTWASLAAGSEAEAPGALALTIDPLAADGDVITLQWDAVRVGDQHDYSDLQLSVAAPAWEVVSLATVDGTLPRAGQISDLALTLRNTGSVATTGGTVTLDLLTVGAASLGTGTAALPASAPGATVVTAAAFDLDVDSGTATATNLTFGLDVLTTEGYRTATTCAAMVGPVDIAAPVGPDNYGYYAYDSADYDYPASRPVYAWQEISTAFGGPGTALDFPIENGVVWMVVDLPFTFRYYGQDYTQMRVSDNGWISFDTGSDYDFYNWTIPTQYGVEALVAPFWDNLNPVPPANSEDNVNGIDPDGIYTFSDVANGSFVVEWSRLPHYKPEILGLQTFQVVLQDPAQHPTGSGDGELLFFYRQVNNNDHLRMYATVGIESPDGSDGIQLSYGNVNAPGMAPLQPGLAVRITTETPSRVPFAIQDFEAAAEDGQVTLRWQPTDDRPVLGWHVDLLRDGGRERLTAAPLAGTARQFTASLPTELQDGDRFLLTALHPLGVSTEPGVATAATAGGTRLALYAAQPNPAPGSTALGFTLPRDTHVRLRVYDVAGRLVRSLVDGRVASGEGVKIWDGRDESGQPVAGGVYFYRLEAGADILTRKMILVR